MSAAFRSRGSPVLPSGVLDRMCCMAFSSWKTDAVISLGKNPGAIELTFILYAAHSIARALVKFITAPLEA